MGEGRPVMLHVASCLLHGTHTHTHAHTHTPAQDLFTVVRSKAHKRRAVGSILWRLGKGLELAVKLYQMVQRQRIPPVRLRRGALLALGLPIWVSEKNRFSRPT